MCQNPVLTGFVPLSFVGMNTLVVIRIALSTVYLTAIFYAVPALAASKKGSGDGAENPSVESLSSKVSRSSPSAQSGQNRRPLKTPLKSINSGRANNISQNKTGLKPFIEDGLSKKRNRTLAQANSQGGRQRIQPPKDEGDEGSGPNVKAANDKNDPIDDKQVNLRDPIDPASTPGTTNGGLVKDETQSKEDKSKGASTPNLQPMGVIRFDAGRSKPRPVLKGGLSIFSSLDEALVKSPRAAALRAFLPITKAMFARATEQPSPEFFYDEGVRAEENRRLGAVFNWEPPWKLVFRLLVAKQSVSARKLELMAQLWMLRADVRRAYTEVVVAQETLETLTSLYDLAHRLRVVSEKRFAAGDVPELDLLKARLAESRYDVEKRVGLRRVIRAKQQLNIIMGRAPEQPLSIPRLPPFLKTKEMKGAAQVRNPLLPDFSKPIPTLQTFIEKAVVNRFELKTINQNLVLNKANTRRAIGDIAPTPQFWIGQSAAGNPPIGPKLNAYYVGVSVPTQITSFNQGDIAEYRAQKRQLKYEYGAQKNVITAEVSSAYNNVLAARQWLKVYEDHVLADSYEVARLARRSYEVGQSDITSTLQAQQNNVQIRSLYLEAITLYQKAFTELEMACGAPLLEEE